MTHPSITPLPAFPAEAFDRLLPWAFAEDEGHGDVTSLATIAEGAVGRARLLCKQSGVIAGLPLVERVFRHRGFHPTLVLLCREGEEVAAGRELMTLQGSLRALLVCERIL